jgi:multiple sugar transport system substrate-binding protein
MPRVPEWEQIAQKLVEDLEPAVRGRESVSEALARLDADVDRILEKRRWMLSRRR